ncbi:triacylglycerol lipase [Streptomyces sp. 5-8]|uniref:Triacylglycerol lipase n=2 Tax=Streptomyces TaxID=1883 RepID=A0ABS1P9M5_9ACTN|nr:triacylglycerol lipase [Streptomyces musisoli]MBY8842884.1 triacylglycerol lipase [Streptomyces sp. SP2-10]
MRYAYRASTLASLFTLLPAAMAAPVMAAHAAAVPDPVVFVHGWNSDGSTWNTMAERFRADGWPTGRLHQWSYPTNQSNATTASQLAQEIDRVLAATGAAKVDLVTHSMGGLSSRHYLKYLAGDAKVDAWVSLAGPNHGTGAAYLCGGASCTEMRPGSSFLNKLNAGDETPGTTRYATWRSSCDSVVTPADTVALAGALNTMTSCLQHSALLTDAAVYQEVRNHVAPGGR